VPSNIDKPYDRIMRFFAEYKGIKHVAPKGFGNRVQRADFAHG